MKNERFLNISRRTNLKPFTLTFSPSCCVIHIILSCCLLTGLQAKAIGYGDAFAFVEHLVAPIHGQDNYLTKTSVEVDDRGDYNIIKSHLYSNALAAIVLTHRWKEGGNIEHLNKAAGILNTLVNFQYPETDATVAGAFPNLLIAEDYHANPGATTPYSVDASSKMVRHGNNAWFLMSLGYYTLETGDRKFVPQLEALADYLSSGQAQNQIPGSPTEGAIFMGWGSAYEATDVRKSIIVTEHQTEAYAGLLYAAEVLKHEPGGALKAQHYLECAYKILRFTISKLYNPNNPGPGIDSAVTCFHTGITEAGEIIPGHIALDAQTWTNLAFSRALQGIEDITNALDYAWLNMYAGADARPIMTEANKDFMAKFVLENYDDASLETGEARLEGGAYLGPYGGGSAVVTSLPAAEPANATLKFDNYGSNWGVIQIKTFTASDVSEYTSLEFSFLSESDDRTRTVQIQLGFENTISDSENTWNWVAPPTLSAGYNEWTQVSIPLDATHFTRAVAYAEGNDFDLTRLNRIAVVLLNNGAAAGTENPVYVDNIKLVKTIESPCAINTSVKALAGIDQVFGLSKTLYPSIGYGALWFENDEGIWLTGSAQLAYAYDYSFNHLDGDAEDAARGEIIFSDMSAMEWPADTLKINARYYSWPKGGFQVFSDGYKANSESLGCIKPEAYPNVEPTAWRYFDIHDLNPYAILLSTPMVAPMNVVASNHESGGIALSWDTDPMAVSYCILRNGEVIGHVSNLNNAGSTFVDTSPQPGISNTYSVAARDLSGQLGTFSDSRFYAAPTKLLANDGAANNYFGGAVALSGDIAIVGALGDDDNGQNSGSAYIINTRNGRQIKLLAGDGTRQDRFGYRVAADGRIAVITAIGDSDNGTRSGAAYLFDMTTGTQLHKLIPTDGAKGDMFGSSVAIDGNIAIIGASLDDDNGKNSGSAYLFDITTGQQLHKLMPTDATKGARFGCSVAIHGDLAIVGADKHHGKGRRGRRSGAAFVFDVTTGDQLFKLLPNKGSRRSYFGASVAIDGTTALIGAHKDSCKGRKSGAAYVFDARAGKQIHKLVASDGTHGDSFGSHIALDSNMAVIGAKFDNDYGNKSGSAYVFDVRTGNELQKLLPHDGGAHDEFGWHVDIDSGKAIVSSVKDSDNGVKSGSAYVFNVR